MLWKQQQLCRGYSLPAFSNCILKVRTSDVPGECLDGNILFSRDFLRSLRIRTPAVAWGAAAGLFVSTITGYLLKYPAEKGVEGLWGFNGILVGCALPTFLGNVPLMWLAVIIFSAMTTWDDGRFKQPVGSLQSQFLHFSFRTNHLVRTNGGPDHARPPGFRSGISRTTR